MMMFFDGLISAIITIVLFALGLTSSSFSLSSTNINDLDNIQGDPMQDKKNFVNSISYIIVAGSYYYF
jgi:hypothetical protein